ncbi:zinc finger protein 239-like [Diaphorina citri]|uniref:Zinc finger protein 239-like n=1 Tax=Diaphorina citri TaxID=121845 RepID=A0A1S3DE05_DIACI|nr:zinc finger protein 239-like [Diaphorina citri]
MAFSTTPPFILSFKCSKGISSYPCTCQLPFLKTCFQLLQNYVFAYWSRLKEDLQDVCKEQDNPTDNGNGKSPFIIVIELDHCYTFWINPFDNVMVRGEKPHVCSVCSKGFSTSSSLNTHRRIHSGEKPHQCQVCGKRFTASSNLYYHRMTHIKEKPHKCSLCSKSFPTPGDLKSHMYVHNGSWPFKCHICNRGFSKHTNLKNHLFLHTGDKPHACDLCNKKFALACNLRAHMKTHEGETHEECIGCGKVYLSSTGKGYCGVCYTPPGGEDHQTYIQSSEESCEEKEDDSHDEQRSN